ncbi:MAG: hypothetical protein HYT50_01305 [Candidatus Wildermuthbacteria bacterium]|nr:hypothetical protein [Candidatus Wildermuthbacteria bacterium]
MKDLLIILSVVSLAVAWGILWKFLAVRKALSLRQWRWALFFALVSTLGILEILYLFRWSREDR